MRAISSDGLPIAFETCGTGEPTVLLHGLTETRDSWQDAGYLEPLLHAGRQLILIDCRGHGESGKPHLAHAYSGTNRVDDVVAVLDTLGVSSAHFIGFSMGGMIAMAMSIRQAHRVRSLTAIAAHPGAQQMQVFREMFARGLAPWLTMVTALYPEQSQESRDRIKANDIRALQACVAFDRPDISAALRIANVPTLLACGTLDPMHEPARRYAAFSGCGLPLEERNHVTSFLAVEEIVAASLALGSQSREPALT